MNKIKDIDEEYYTLQYKEVKREDGIIVVIPYFEKKYT